MILSLLPVLFTLQMEPDGDVMKEYLTGCLQSAGICMEPLPDDILFVVEDEDSTTCRGSHDHFFQIAMLTADSSSSSVMHRFRVYRDGTIFWFSPLPGMYIPWDDFINGVTEL